MDNKCSWTRFERLPKANLRCAMRLKKQELIDTLLVSERKQQIIDRLCERYMDLRATESERQMLTQTIHKKASGIEQIDCLLDEFVLGDMNRIYIFIEECMKIPLFDESSIDKLLEKIAKIAESLEDNFAQIIDLIFIEISKPERHFHGLHDRTNVIDMLYGREIITDDTRKGILESSNDEEKCNFLIFRVLYDLVDYQQITAFFRVLEETGNKGITEKIQEPVKPKIEQLIESARKAMLSCMQQRYTEKYGKVKVLNIDGQETVIDFSQEDAVNDVIFKAVEISPTKDEIPAKVSERITQLLNPSTPYKRILMQADPGCGKTTLLRLYLFQCISRETVLPIYIPVKRIKSTNLSDIIFKDLALLEEKYWPVLEYELQRNDLELVLLIDGVDDMHIDNKGIFLKSLLNSETEPYCTDARVIVTCRIYTPEVTLFRKTAEAAITLQGFSEDNQLKFIKKHLNCDDQRARQYLTRFSEMFDDSMRSIPVLLLLQCRLVETKPREGHKSHSIFGVFDLYFDTLRAQIIDGENPKLTGEILDDIFNKIGGLSFNGILERKDLFTVEDFRQYGLSISDVSRLGCFSIDETSKEYKFLHKTLGEYFAGAHYCAKRAFGKVMLEILYRRGLFNELPYVMFLALEMADEKVMSLFPDLSHNTQREDDDFQVYEADRKRCVLYEKTKCRSLQSTLGPLDGCIQFACGKNPDFAASLFVFGLHACKINMWKRESPLEEKYYDLRYECSLIMDLKTEHHVYERFLDFLIKCEKYEHFKHQKSVSPNLYHKASARYLVKSLPNASKVKLVQALYGLDCGLFSDDAYETKFIVALKDNQKKDLDVLLGAIENDKLPNKVQCQGKVPFVRSLKFHLDEKSLHLTELIIWKLRHDEELTSFSALLLTLRSQLQLVKVRLLNCSLGNDQFQMLEVFLHVRKHLPLPALEITGCLSRSIPNTFLHNLLSCCIEKAHLRVTILQNALEVNCAQKDRKIYLISINTVDCRTLPLEKCFPDVCELSICDSAIYDANIWDSIWNGLNESSELTQLKLEKCHFKIKDDLNLLANAINGKENLDSLVLSHNDLSEVDNNTFAGFWQALASCSALRVLELENCEIKDDCLDDFLKTVTKLKNIADLNMYGNFPKTETIDILSKLSSESLQTLKLPECRFTTEIQVAEVTCPQEILRGLHLRKGLGDMFVMCSYLAKVYGLKCLSDLTLEKCHIPVCFYRAPFNLHLKVLNLTGSNLGELSEERFCQFTLNLEICALSSLDVSKCCLSESYHFRELSKCIQNAEILNASHNTLTKVTKEDFDMCFGAPFKELMITHCNLQLHHIISIGTFLHRSKTLQHLSLAGNNFSNIPQEDWIRFCQGIRSCKSLKYLKLSKNRLMKQHFKDVFDVISTLQNIEYLNMTVKDCARMPLMDVQMTEKLETCVFLIKLSLSGCKLNTNEVIECLAKVLIRLKCLKHLDLSSNSFSMITAKTWEIFCDNLGESNFLEKVNFDDCCLEAPHHLKYAGRSLKNLPQLERINFSNNNMSQINAASWTLFCDGLKSCVRLRKLKMRNTQIQHSAKLLKMAAVVRALQNLKYFDISREEDDTSIVNDDRQYSHAISALFVGLRQCSALHTLKVAHCKIHHATIDLAETVVKLKFLIDLDVSNNNINELTEEGLKAFLYEFSHSRYLQHVSVANCRLRVKHFAHLAKAIVLCKDLKCLDLSGNYLTDSDFLLNLDHCPKLQSLFLENCRLGKNGLKTLVQVLPKLRCLERLDISKNTILLKEDCDTNPELSDLSKCLSAHDNWKHLGLAGCFQGGDPTLPRFFIDIILHSFPRVCKTLENVGLAAIDIHQIPEVKWEHFLDVLSRSEFLNTVDLSGNPLTSKMVDYFLLNHKFFPRLESLKISCEDKTDILDNDNNTSKLANFQSLRRVNGQNFR